MGHLDLLIKLRIVQVIIMLTPVNTFFSVSWQSWPEWLVAISLGAGSLLVAFITKLLSRSAPSHPLHPSLVQSSMLAPQLKICCLSVHPSASRHLYGILGH